MLERSFGARGTDLQSRWLHGNRQASPGAIRQGFRHLFGASLRLPPLRPIWFCAYPCPHAGHTPPSAAGQVELRWIGESGECVGPPVRPLSSDSGATIRENCGRSCLFFEACNYGHRTCPEPEGPDLRIHQQTRDIDTRTVQGEADSFAAGPPHNAVLLLAAHQTRVFSVACAIG